MTSPVDIRPDHLEVVQDILREYLPTGVKVWVFGSRANWTTKDSSDLDLALEGDGKLSHKVLGTLKDTFDDSSLPYTVDVVDLNRISDSFRQIVKSQREPLPVEEAATIGASLAGSNGQWRTLKLGDVCTKIGSGATPRGGKDVYLQDGSYALIRSQNVYNDGFHRDGLAFIGEHHADELQNVEVFEDDVLLNITGDSVARVCQVAPDTLPARVNQHVAIIRPDSMSLGAGYLRYYLVSPEMQTLLLSWAGSGGTRNALTKGMIESLEIPLPPLDEQRAIAHVLTTLDDKIELNRRMNETLEAMARALFKSWFVDFEPVRAKMEGRWHRGESLLGLPADLYDLFPDRLMESELGEIPEGWEVKRIDEIAERVAMGPFGSSIKVATFVTNGIPVISGQHLGGTLLEDNEYNYITEAHADKLANANVKRGDIVFTHAGSIGQAAYIPPSSQFERYVISQRQFYMRCDTSKISPLFVVHYFKTREGQHQLLANTSSTGVPSIARPVTYLRSIELCVPPEVTWRKFDKIAGAFHSNIACNTEESRFLATQRDALLPGLVSGELRL